MRRWLRRGDSWWTAAALALAACDASPAEMPSAPSPPQDASIPATDAGSDAGAPDTALEPSDTGVPERDAGPDASSPAAPSWMAEARYLVTVRTGGWDTPAGTLERWRRGAGDAWEIDGTPIPIVLGRSGLGWGRGVHGDGAFEDDPGPVKIEGDGRSPAGAFWLDRALGYAPVAPAGTRMPYQPMTPTLQCIEDVASSHYNEIVDRALVPPDWTSTDLLRRTDGLYELIVFVRHNTDPEPIPGRGSCILLHVWTDTMRPTAGCTSMALESLADVIRSLEPDHNLLVQLPQPVYDGVAPSWGLPPSE